MLGVAAEEKVYISDFSIKPGETKRIALCFDTEREDVTQLLGTVTMPAGLTVQNQSDAAGSYIWMTGNDARTNGAFVSYNAQDGSVKMVSLFYTFTEGTGAVAYIDVMASSSLAETSTISISGFKVMNGQGTYTNIASENCTVTLDTSGQGGEQSGEVSFAFSPANLTLEKGQSASVEVTMTNSVSLSGIGATLTASTGLSITSVTKSSRIVGTFFYDNETGKLVILGSINGSEGTLLNVGLKVDDDFTGSSATLTISDLDLTSASAQSFSSSDIALNVKLPAVELTLNEATDNSEVLTSNNGKLADVTLTRTLQTGGWNTFSVPFSMDIPTGWTVKELDSSVFNNSTGVLTLNFIDATSIVAGTPYLVQVESPVANPTFSGVTINNRTTTKETDAAYFVPVVNPAPVTGGDKTVLFVTGGNKLTWPLDNGYINGFRAYFKLKGESVTEARSFLMNFEDNLTGIQSLTPRSAEGHSQGEAPYPYGDRSIYTLDGRRLQSLPAQRTAEGCSLPQGVKKGVYIVNGKKTVIK
jgi:hypothetical protein